MAVAGDAAQRPCGLGDVAVDREYTQSNDGSDFLMPVRALGGKPVFDLKVTQVGPSGIIRGAVITDGRPFSPSIPENLIQLTPPRGKNDSTGRPDPIALAEYEASIALRKKYALVLHQIKDGTYVFQCPAAAGNVGCTIQQPRRATNKILPLAVNPPSVVAPDSVCAAQFRSFGFEELPHYQEETFGSTEHRLSYRRRGASVEPAFGAIKDFAGEGLQRGKCRVVSTPKTGLFLAFAMASANLRPAQAYDRRQQSMRSSSPANAPADPATRA